MPRLAPLSALTAAAAIAVSVFVAPAAGAQTVDCNANKFAVGGWPAPQIVPAGYQAIPTPGGMFPWERGGFNHGQAVGVANTIATVDAFAAACPGTPIVLKGHSYGAGIVSTAVETIDGQPYAPRVHVDLTGNPRRVGGIEDTIGRGVTIFPGITMRGAARVPVNVGSYSDRCNPQDGICDLPPLFQNPVGHFWAIVGYFTGAHRY